MFLVCVGVPQYHTFPDGSSVFFDGKIGIWTLGERKPAVQNSKNRAKGTLEVKEISVTAEVFYEYMTKAGGVLEAIKEVRVSILLARYVCLF